MTDDKGLLGRLKARGEEVFGAVASQLMANPQFVKAVQGAARGKEKMDHAVGPVLKQMNIPTRSEFKKALARIEALERQLAALQEAAKPASRRARKAKGKTETEPTPGAAE